MIWSGVRAGMIGSSDVIPSVLAPLRVLALAAMCGSLIAPAASAQEAGRAIVGEEYTPTIWIDPDGCQHWVMDDGFEGFMTPRRTRDGRPVCFRNEICGVMPTDTLFATDRATINPAARTKLEEFFRSAEAYGFMIYGHTDARASDEYNLRLSRDRAEAVAGIAAGLGLRVVDIKGFGERQPRAAGNSAGAYQQNRRVEVYCVK